MKIVFFLPSLAGGGAERMVINLIKGLRAYPCELELVVANGVGEWLSILPDDVPFIDLQVNRIIKSIPALANQLRKSQPDILFSAIDHANIAAIIAGKISGTGLTNVISIQRMSTHIRKVHQNKREKIIDFLKPFLYTKADRIVCVSDGICSEMMDEYHLPKDKLERIYNPILFKKDINAEKNENRHKSNSDKKVIVAAGRLEEVKDFSTLISAINLVKNDLECKLIIYGEGPQRANLEEKIKALDLQEFVILPGFVLDLQAELCKADLFVLSSITEGFGNVLVEAMASGIPIVSTDCPSGPREILKNGKYGTLVPVGDVKAMANAIINVLQQNIDYQILFSRAEQFTIEKISAAYFLMFSTLLDKG